MSWGVVMCKDMGWGAINVEGWRKGPWTAEEDRLLTEYVKSHGEGRWNKVCRLAGLQRNGKSCRLRWVNYLRPDLKKGQITPHEERIILELHAKWGNRWSTIARSLPGRTDNEIKNYWRTHFKKSCKSSAERRLLRRQQFQLQQQQQQQKQHEQAQMDMKKIESLKGNFNQEVVYPTASDEERLLYSMSTMTISNYAPASNEEILWDGLWNLGDLHGNYVPGKPVYPNNFAASD